MVNPFSIDFRAACTPKNLEQVSGQGITHTSNSGSRAALNLNTKSAVQSLSTTEELLSETLAPSLCPLPSESSETSTSNTDIARKVEIGFDRLVEDLAGTRVGFSEARHEISRLSNQTASLATVLTEVTSTLDNKINLCVEDLNDFKNLLFADMQQIRNNISDISLEAACSKQANLSTTDAYDSPVPIGRQDESNPSSPRDSMPRPGGRILSPPHTRSGLRRDNNHILDQANQEGQSPLNRTINLGGTPPKTLYSGHGNYLGSQPRYNQTERDVQFDQREARKRSFEFTKNPIALPKFESLHETIGYFLKGRLLLFTQSNGLKLIELIEPWLHHTVPSIPAIKLRNAKDNAKKGLLSTDVDTFFIRVARALHGKGKPIESVALAKLPQESIQAFAERLLIENETVARQSFDEIRSESELVNQVFYHLSCNCSHDVKIQFAQAQRYLNLGVINTVKALDTIATNVDEILGGATSNDQVAAISATNSRAITLRENPYDSPQKSPGAPSKKHCKKCNEEFQPEREYYVECRQCFQAEQICNQRKTCIKCAKPFNPERPEHNQCRPCFVKNRPRSRSGGDSNHRDQSQYGNSRGRSMTRYPSRKDKIAAVSSEPEKTGSETHENEPDSLMMISGPLRGDEFHVNPEFFDEDSIASILTQFGIPKNKQRIYLRTHLEGIEATVLVDSGATVDTFQNRLCEKLGLKPQPGTSRKVLDFEGKECDTKGIVKKIIPLGRAQYESNFTVINSSHGPDIILGTPFLNRYGLNELLKERISGITGPNVVCNENPKN